MKKQSGFLINAGPTMMILAFLKGGSKPAYSIAQEIKKLSDGRLQLQRSTLYPLLNKMQKEGFIETSWDLPANDVARRLYRLTEKGEAEATKQLEAWRDYTETIGHVLGSLGH